MSSCLVLFYQRSFQTQTTLGIIFTDALLPFLFKFDFTFKAAHSHDGLLNTSPGSSTQSSGASKPHIRNYQGEFPRKIPPVLTLTFASSQLAIGAANVNVRTSRSLPAYMNGTAQACREAKCQTGDPDTPSPPCERCVREGKVCEFSTNRRKRSGDTSDESDDSLPKRAKKASDFKIDQTDSNTGGGVVVAQPLSPDPGLNIHLQPWLKLSICRHGTIHPAEAALFVEHFYESLFPQWYDLSNVPDYSHPSTHRQLLDKEPLLAVTTLAISFSCTDIGGPRGKSGSEKARNELKSYLTGMLAKKSLGHYRVEGETGPANNCVDMLLAWVPWSLDISHTSDELLSDKMVYHDFVQLLEDRHMTLRI